MSQEDNFSPVISSTEVQDDDLSKSDSDEGDQIPDRAMLSLNSKKLVISQLRQLVTSLEIFTKGTLRQVIYGKLIQLCHEPRNTPVVVRQINFHSSLWIYILQVTLHYSQTGRKETKGAEMS